jgi:chromosome partitioning protein
MKKAAVTINKGGVGKTMFCRSLGTAAAQAGLFVVILDMDSQENATSWRSRRPQKELPLPLVEFTTERNLEEAIKRAEAAGADLVLIDTPPGRTTEAPAAVEVSDLVLIPCTSEPECTEGLPRTARLVRTTGKRAFVVPNFVHPSGKNEDELIRGLAKLHGLACAPVTLHQFNVHVDGSYAGKTAPELEPNGRAAKEINALWDWFYAELHNGINASMHEVA